MKAWLQAARTLYSAIHKSYSCGVAFGSRFVHEEAFIEIQEFANREQP